MFFWGFEGSSIRRIENDELLAETGRLDSSDDEVLYGVCVDVCRGEVTATTDLALPYDRLRLHACKLHHWPEGL